MANDVLGADPEDVAALARQMHGAGIALEASRSRLGQRLEGVEWTGSDATALRGVWAATAAASGRSALAELERLARHLEAQALEQRQASGDAIAGPGERPGELRSTGLGGGGSPLTVLTERHTVGVAVGASPVDAGAEATLTLTVASDGTAEVSVRTDQGIGALVGEASAGAGMGLSGSNQLTFGFENEATARAFVDEMTDAMTPDLEALGGASPPGWLAGVAGLGLPVTIVGGGKALLDDVGRDVAEVMLAHSPLTADGASGVQADVWAAGALDRSKMDAEIARGASYHPTTGVWETHTTVGADAAVRVLGDAGAELAGETSVRTVIGRDGIERGTWSVELTGGGTLAVLGALGVGGAPGFDVAGNQRVKFEASLSGDSASARAALGELNRATPDPRRVASSLDRMVRDGELTVTVEGRSGGDDGRSYGPVRLTSTHEVVQAEEIYRRTPGSGGWERVHPSG
ncbi:MAG: hypothetical protein R2754_16645 [Microthrixaceae bacterium]